MSTVKNRKKPLQDASTDEHKLSMRAAREGVLTSTETALGRGVAKRSALCFTAVQQARLTCAGSLPKGTARSHLCLGRVRLCASFSGRFGPLGHPYQAGLSRDRFGRKWRRGQSRPQDR